MSGRIKKRFLQGIIVLILLGVVYYPGYKKVQEAKSENRKLSEKVDLLVKENIELEKKLELLQTDMVYIEKRAREKLGIVREGEIIYEFVPEEQNESRGGAVR
ncbi:MAG: septum formation initiator family protein [Candidatus Saelkia tenebricola]|nr:septum formation initiator family protein [Candidatus Saelkia tenebricola]